MPAPGSHNTSLHCRDTAAISRLDADALRALRQCGQLRLGKARYRVEWGARDPGGCGIAVTPLGGESNEAERVRALLQRREQELSVHGGDYAGAGLHRLKHACQLLCAPATTALAETEPLKRMLTAGHGELRCGRHRYAIRVTVHRNGVEVTALRLDLSGNRLVRFMQAVADVFRRGSFRSRADEIGRMLTAAARSPAVAAQRIVPAPEPRSAEIRDAHRAADKARAEAAIKAIRAKTKAQQRQKGINGNLPRDYPKVDLSRIGPADMDWSGIDLSYLDLSDTSLKHYNLAGANLRESQLYCTDLSGANLTGADLSGVRTCITKLTGANLIGARMAGMRLDRVDFRRANCAGVDFSVAGMELGRPSNFSDACLVGANFRSKYLGPSDFSRADLRRANLALTTLSEVRFEGARLGDACLDDANLPERPFTGTDLRGASLRNVFVDRGDWLKSAVDAGATTIEPLVSIYRTAENQERHLNHRTNATSLQKNIDAIGDEEVKVRLMHRLVEALLSAIASPFDGRFPALRDIELSMIDVLAGNPLYAQKDAQIAGVVEQWCDRELERGDTTLLAEPLPGAVLIRLMEAAMQRLETAATAADSGLCIMQLAYRARTECKDPRALDLAARLTTAWHNKLPEPLQNALAQASDMAQEPLFTLVCRKTGGAVMMSEDYFANRFLEKRLDGEFPDVTWQMLWEFQPDNAGQGAVAVGPVRDVGKALSPFKPLSAIYATRDCAKARPQLLKAMGLEPFATEFLAAIQAGGANSDLNSPRQQQRLEACLAANIEGNFVNGQVKDGHVSALLGVYSGLPTQNAREKAYFLLCLSAMMVRLSSSQYFGREFESPLPLRGYAGALLNKAYALAPNLMDNATVLADWKNHLFGLNKAFDCTALLSGEMLQVLGAMARGDQRFRSIWESLLPAAWR